MMDDRIVLGQTTLHIPSHIDVKPDKDGYYRLPVGAFNFKNSVGAFYTYDGVVDAFKNDETFNRRIKNGQLGAEYRHPEQGKLTSKEFKQRLMTIRRDRECANIRKVELVKSNTLAHNGEPVYYTYAEIKPMGPFKDVLIDRLNDKYANVAFSIRGFAHDQVVNGLKIRRLFKVITWDAVEEPGISVATKNHLPTLESLDYFQFDPKTFDGDEFKSTVMEHIDGDDEYINSICDVVNSKCSKINRGDYLDDRSIFNF
jgi:hypothetical protein